MYGTGTIRSVFRRTYGPRPQARLGIRQDKGIGLPLPLDDALWHLYRVQGPADLTDETAHRDLVELEAAIAKLEDEKQPPPTA
jgi:hypothetical protein